MLRAPRVARGPASRYLAWRLIQESQRNENNDRRLVVCLPCSFFIRSLFHILFHNVPNLLIYCAQGNTSSFPEKLLIERY